MPATARHAELHAVSEYVAGQATLTLTKRIKAGSCR